MFSSSHQHFHSTILLPLDVDEFDFWILEGLGRYFLPGLFREKEEGQTNRYYCK